MPIFNVVVCTALCFVLLGCGLVCGQATSTGSGQGYPSKAIRIVTSAAGGGNDIQTRFFSPVIASALGQPVVIDNRGGSVVSSELVSKSPADGYTLLYNGSSLWQTPLLEKAPYDMRDFAPVSQVAREILLLVVHPSLPVKSVKELIALAKSKPGQLNYGSSVPGSGGHLGMELFKSVTATNIVWIPHKATTQNITSVVSGEVQMTMTNPSVVLPYVKSGRLKALAVTSATPSELYPDLPTVAASGAPGFEMVAFTGVFAPAKTPYAIVNRLSQEIVRAISQPEVKQKFLISGVEAAGSSPEQFDAAIKADTSKMVKVIKEANIKLER